MELLAPAGSIDAFYKAISSGCNAIYLGMKDFGARAYASNFDNETLTECVKYAHLRNVKIYVTMNIIVFDYELERVFDQIDFLASINIDGIIACDLAVIDYAVKHQPSLEVHASTQMGLDDYDGVMFVKKMGVKRAVLGREVSIDKALKVKSETDMPIELFGHGALCVSYSGNCLMSGLIGYRSGNRGRCVGSCRKKYELIDITENKSYGKAYHLSMKDLNTIGHIDKLRNIDSLKIEGRMKEHSYVGNVISCYRQAIDDLNSDIYELNDKLSKSFNRTFTKGYLLNENNSDISNILKANHNGYYVGYIKSKKKDYYTISLEKTLNQNDVISIVSKEDISFPVVKLYDLDLNLINSSNTTCIIKMKEEAFVGDKVYVTSDYKFNLELEADKTNKCKKLPLDVILFKGKNNNLCINLSYLNTKVSYESEFILETSIKHPFNKEIAINQLNRLNDTPYYLNKFESFGLDEFFIPNSILNTIRRSALILLDNERLEFDYKKILDIKEEQIAFDIKEPILSVYCHTQEQYNACKELGIKTIYYNNICKRNDSTYNLETEDILVEGYNGLNHYKGRNITTDFSLNVSNYKAVYNLHKMGANKVTLSYEMSAKSINELIDNYYEANNGYPNLELIVYGRSHLLETKYCPLKKFNLCGICKTHKFVLKDEVATFPILKNSFDCRTNIVNEKILNLGDDLLKLNHIASYRISLTIENYSESIEIISKFINKLTNDDSKIFNSNTDTRGHFNKEIL